MRIAPSKTFLPCGERNWAATYTTGKRYGTTGAPPIYRFDEDLLESVLRSFPAKSERKSFVTRFCCPSSPSQGDLLLDRLDSGKDRLERAYRTDPHRKDWPRILADLGLWP